MCNTAYNLKAVFPVFILDILFVVTACTHNMSSKSVHSLKIWGPPLLACTFAFVGIFDILGTAPL